MPARPILEALQRIEKNTRFIAIALWLIICVGVAVCVALVLVGKFRW